MTILPKVDFNATLKDYQSRANEALQARLPGSDLRPQRLHEAMRYSIEVGGKRLRPILVLAGSSLFDHKEDPLPTAVAVEFFHTATLIHDDLPSMDDSDLRRGQNACHKQFDEATALLAGDALMVESFKVLTSAYSYQPAILSSLVCELSYACGSTQLMGGQMEDLLAEEAVVSSAEQLDFIHSNKTAALIRASLTMGVLLSNPDKKALEIIRAVGQSIGLAFQIVDDILDVSSTTEVLGKATGQDARNQKLTYPVFHGLEASKRKAEVLTNEALKLLASLHANTSFLEDLCCYMLSRKA